MDMLAPEAFGLAAMAASTLAASCAGSAPMRFRMAVRLFSAESSSALSMCKGSMMLAWASEATPMEAWNAS